MRVVCSDYFIYRMSFCSFLDGTGLGSVEHENNNQYSNLVEMLKGVASNSADKFLISSELTPETSAIK